MNLKEWKERWQNKEVKEGFTRCSTNISPTGYLKFTSVSQDWWIYAPELNGGNGQSFASIPDERVWLSLPAVVKGGRAWRFWDSNEKYDVYVSNWFCSDGDGAELYIEKLDEHGLGGGFELECFSGIPSSHIYLDSVDFNVFWKKAGLDALDHKPTYEEQCFMIADYLCSLFNEWHDKY